MPVRIPQELVESLRDDWVYLAEVLASVKGNSTGQSDDQIFESAIEIISYLLTNSVIQVGDLERSGFVSWELSVPETVKRIRDRRQELGGEISIGDVCWLNLVGDIE